MRGEDAVQRVELEGNFESKLELKNNFACKKIRHIFAFTVRPPSEGDDKATARATRAPEPAGHPILVHGTERRGRVFFV